MKQALLIDCCIRGEASRTKKLAEAFLAALPKRYQVTQLDLTQEPLQPLRAETLRQRETLLARGDLSHRQFRLAHQLALADLVVIAAPFWDLSFPALLKVYVENVSVEGITFCSTSQGFRGLCRAAHCVLLTTRGGCYEGADAALEQGTPYLRALQRFFGFGDFTCVAAEGLDVQGLDASARLEVTCRQAETLAQHL